MTLCSWSCQYCLYWSNSSDLHLTGFEALSVLARSIAHPPGAVLRDCLTAVCVANRAGASELHVHWSPEMPKVSCAHRNISFPCLGLRVNRPRQQGLKFGILSCFYSQALFKSKSRHRASFGVLTSVASLEHHLRGSQPQPGAPPAAGTVLCAGTPGPLVATLGKHSPLCHVPAGAGSNHPRSTMRRTGP